MHTLQSHKNPVSFVSWSPDDTKLLTCGNAEVLKLWDVDTGVLRHTFGNNDSGFTVSSCAWFPDSTRLVCGSSDPERGIVMWDTDGNEIKAWRGTRIPKVSIGVCFRFIVFGLKMNTFLIGGGFGCDAGWREYDHSVFG